MRNLPWLEIALTAILAIMLVVGINAIFGSDIRQGFAEFCTANELWCAPPTPTPTVTPTPVPTQTLAPTMTPTDFVTPLP